ncbi:MAG: hypothetical protein LUF82_04945 [Clostridia bacterium]|nr:hypothetical protein [Clostridia bacterium]
MAKTGVTENRNRRYIRINDIDTWDMIDEVSELNSSYSFNEIVNRALMYGLPELIKYLKGEVKLEPTEEVSKGYSEYELEQMKYYGTVVHLLKEINLNLLLCKSMLSQLVNAYGETLAGNRVIYEKYCQGAYSDTPDFLVDYETRELKKLRQY